MLITAMEVIIKNNCHDKLPDRLREEKVTRTVINLNQYLHLPDVYSVQIA